MTLAASHPPQWRERRIEAALALHENRLDVAERLLKAHLKDDPFDSQAIRMLAEVAGRLGRMTIAESLLRRALELHGECVGRWQAGTDRITSDRRCGTQDGG